MLTVKPIPVLVLYPRLRPIRAESIRRLQRDERCWVQKRIHERWGNRASPLEVFSTYSTLKPQSKRPGIRTIRPMQPIWKKTKQGASDKYPQRLVWMSTTPSFLISIELWLFDPEWFISVCGLGGQLILVHKNSLMDRGRPLIRQFRFAQIF